VTSIQQLIQADGTDYRQNLLLTLGSESGFTLFLELQRTPWV